jgi:flagellar assembly factor FliW
MTTAAAVALPAPARPAPVRVQALSLVEPLPGFPGHRDYVLVPAEDAGRLFWLQSVASAGPRFLAVPAAAFFPDYAPAIPGAVRAELGLADTAVARLYCLVTVPAGDAHAATANLRAPLAVNPARGAARQVVVPDAAHPIRRLLRR